MQATKKAARISLIADTESHCRCRGVGRVGLCVSRGHTNRNPGREGQAQWDRDHKPRAVSGVAGDYELSNDVSCGVTAVEACRGVVEAQIIDRSAVVEGY